MKGDQPQLQSLLKILVNLIVVAFTYPENFNLRLINGVEDAKFALVNSVDAGVSFQLLIVVRSRVFCKQQDLGHDLLKELWLKRNQILSGGLSNSQRVRVSFAHSRCLQP
jgi:hypothetical protein